MLFKRLPGNDLPLPRRETTGASGMDLRACLTEPLSLSPGQRVLIPTGFAMALPDGYEAQVRPRSGLALKSGVTMLNTPGTIDADYRGEVSVLAVNLGSERVTIQRGDRIAQMVIQRVSTADLVEVEALPPSARGEGGFGSSGSR
ncbi:MAG TPA: dUTP diphosphatase [Patescibacteria group bacterium]|nr:dUTP diphosphatase [Patescibacteria group bacterium]